MRITKETLCNVSTGYKIVTFNGEKPFMTEMEENEFYELVMKKETFIDKTLLNTKESIETLEKVYELSNNNNEIASKILNDNIYLDYPEEGYIRESVAEDYSEEILAEVKNVVNSYYSTNNALDFIESEEAILNFEKFLIDQVSEIVCKIPELSEFKDFNISITEEF